MNGEALTREQIKEKLDGLLDKVREADLRYTALEIGDVFAALQAKLAGVVGQEKAELDAVTAMEGLRKWKA